MTPRETQAEAARLRGVLASAIEKQSEIRHKHKQYLQAVQLTSKNLVDLSEVIAKANMMIRKLEQKEFKQPRRYE